MTSNKAFQKIYIIDKTFISIDLRKRYNQIENILIEVDPKEKIFEEKYSLEGWGNLQCPPFGPLTGQKVQNFFRGSKTLSRSPEKLFSIYFLDLQKRGEKFFNKKFSNFLSTILSSKEIFHVSYHSSSSKKIAQNYLKNIHKKKKKI